MLEGLFLNQGVLDALGSWGIDIIRTCIKGPRRLHASDISRVTGLTLQL